MAYEFVRDDGLNEQGEEDKREHLREGDEVKFAEVALRAGAREARLEGVTLLITSSAHSRLRILRAIEEAGGNIERLATDEPLIEEFFLRYVNAKTVDR